MVNIDASKIALSFLGSIIFGIIHGILYLVIEPHILEYVEDITFFDESMAGVTTSAISHCITILVVYALMYNINKNYELFENILIDVAGILIGISIILTGYYIYIKNSNNNNNNNNSNNRNNSNNNSK